VAEKRRSLLGCAVLYLCRIFGCYIISASRDDDRDDLHRDEMRRDLL
jgi:hypothetical protein